jgi:hypothetical protein
MLTLTLAVIGAFAAAIATCAALWQGFILRRQLENDTSVRRASFHQGVANLFIQLDVIFIENPDLRPYFYENQAPPDPGTKQQALALSEYIADLAESCIAAEYAEPELTGDWDDYFNYLYQNSHVLREYWASFGHLYPQRVARALVGPSARPKKWPSAQEYEIMGDDQQDDGAGPSMGH